MFEYSNEIENPASNGYTQRGEVIMNPFQKAAAAVIALAITLVGATFVTAPLALADVHPLASHQAVSVSCLAPNSASMRMQCVRRG